MSLRGCIHVICEKSVGGSEDGFDLPFKLAGRFAVLADRYLCITILAG
jgi:hypothetical protein